jgi:hypothetical protein
MDLGSNESGTMSLQVSDGLLTMWGVSANDLFEISKSNIVMNEEGSFYSMVSVIGELVGSDLDDEYEDRMYVLSNQTKVYGSSTVLCEDVMKKVIEKIGDDFFILPSSVHELIIVPNRDDAIKLADLEMMVREVNATQVEENDRLSDNVYRYTLENGLKLA